MGEVNKKDVEIEKFLEGGDDLKYLINVEAHNYSNKVARFFQDPDKGFYSDEDSFTPFLYMKDFPNDIKGRFYKGDQHYKQKKMVEYGISIKKLITKKANKAEHQRLRDGYKYLVSTTKTYNDITKFFMEGGVDVYKNSSLFVSFKANEQYLIQKRIRLFKGFDFYDDIHKLYFDIETTGLDPYKSRVFLIGLKSNKGYEDIIAVDKENDDDSEIKLIVQFFKRYMELKPSMIAGYNSENFDFNFLIKRLEILGVNIESLETTHNRKRPISKTPSTVKFGGETEKFNKTNIYGINVIDIYHAVRQAKATNSDIKEAGLKYITKFSNINKPNRMYIEGNNIYKYWFQDKWFINNKENNNYEQVPDYFQECLDVKEFGLQNEGFQTYINNQKLKHNRTDFIKGKDIVRQYLLDDLWETAEVDRIFNEASFMKSKMLASSLNKVNTMGGASAWNMIMFAWSYENELAIPLKDVKREFIGGLSRTFLLGFLGEIVKADYAGLYPSIQLEHNVFPKHDITNVLYRLLKYFKETRDIYKKLAKTDPDEKKRQFYETKQLPLKIFNNSNFGANGSEYFYWADMDVAERITVTGRMYLRKLVDFFIKFDFIPSVLDTDGVNYLLPKQIVKDINTMEDIEPISIDDVVYVDSEGNEHKGLDAFFQKFNREMLGGKYMKVDNDGMWLGGVNIGRKNYISYEIVEKNGVKKEKIKLVGNSIKSSNLPKYMDDFIKYGSGMIIKNNPKEFVDKYYDIVNKIYYRQIPAVEIASKAKVKINIEDYCRKIYLPNLLKSLFWKKDYETYKKHIADIEKKGKIDKIPLSRIQEKFNYIFKNKYYVNEPLPEFLKEGKIIQYFGENFFDGVKKVLEEFNVHDEDSYKVIYNLFHEYFSNYGDKNGKPKARQAHMELIIEQEKIVDLGDMIYYVNNGTKKSHGDSSTTSDGKMYASIIDRDKLDTVVDYNIPKYIDDFNTRIEPFMVCFKQHIKETMLITEPKDRKYYTDEDLILVNWDITTYPYNKEDIDGLYDDSVENVALFKPEDREIKFWNKIKVDPKVIFDGFIDADNEKVDENVYYKYFLKYKPLLKKKGIELKDINSKYENGDIVLYEDFLEHKFYLTIFDNGMFHKEKELTL